MWEKISSNYINLDFVQCMRKLVEAAPSQASLKFIYSEKATTFCEIFILLLSNVVPVKSKVNISQNFVAFSEYRNLPHSFRDFSQSEKLSEIEPPLVDLHNLSLGRAFIYTTPQTMTPLWQAK